MAIEVATFEQIVTILSQLSDNYSGLVSNYYNIFFNPVQMDVTLQMYNNEGNLIEFTIPNRAKDRAYILNGQGSPEGAIIAPMGSAYQDLKDGKLYIKISGNGSSGWSSVFTQEDFEDVIVRNTGSPEGVYTRPAGVMYIDKSDSSLYIKATATGNTGWRLISANTSNLADVDLSNLSEVGRDYFANKTLSNLDEEGQVILDSKEVLENKLKFSDGGLTEEILEDVEENKFPSAVATYKFVEDRVANFADLDLNNLSSGGNKKFVNKNQLRDCILYTPSVIGETTTIDNNVLTILGGLTFLYPTGYSSSEGTRSSSEYVLPNTITYEFNLESETDDYVYFYNITDEEVYYCNTKSYYREEQAPEILSPLSVWFDKINNWYNLATYDPDRDTYVWRNVGMIELGRFSSREGNIISYRGYRIFRSLNEADVVDLEGLNYNGVLDIIKLMFPIGSIYLGETVNCPLEVLFGTWELVAAGRVLQGADDIYTPGTTIEAGLPNLTGTIKTSGANLSENNGVFFASTTAKNRDDNLDINGNSVLKFDASRSNPIYGKSSTVQPPAYVVNIWRRVR